MDGTRAHKQQLLTLAGITRCFAFLYTHVIVFACCQCWKICNKRFIGQTLLVFLCLDSHDGTTVLCSFIVDVLLVFQRLGSPTHAGIKRCFAILVTLLVIVAQI